MTTPCRACGAPVEPGRRRRAYCNPCLARRANTVAARSWKRGRGRDVLKRERIVHTTVIICRRCGASESREYTTIRPTTCWDCRAARLRANSNIPS